MSVVLFICVVTVGCSMMCLVVVCNLFALVCCVSCVLLVFVFVCVASVVLFVVVLSVCVSVPEVKKSGARDDTVGPARRLSSRGPRYTSHGRAHDYPFFRDFPRARTAQPGCVQLCILH